jgi:AcrR family transcriptional regulator
MSAYAGEHRTTVAQAERQGAHVSEMQRRRLLAAIGELLGESGVEGASVGAVCRRAAVSRRTFYEAFEDREACFLAAFEQAIERIVQAVGTAYGGEDGAKRNPPSGAQSRGAGPTSWNARVRAGVAALLEHFDAHPGVARMCVVEMLRAGPRVLARRRQVLAALAAAVDEGRVGTKSGNDPLPLTAEGVVGGALAVLHERLLNPPGSSDGAADGGAPTPPRLAELANVLTAMIVQPYLGPAVARRELGRAAPVVLAAVADGARDPFKGLSIRFTYRTARVLATIAAEPGASNRVIADESGIGDEGQMSRLLRRLKQAGLIENLGEGHLRGEPNAWWLTGRGEAVHATLAGVEASSAQ